MVEFESLVKAKFVRRYKRFFMDCKLYDGPVVVAHTANTGSMKSLLDDENDVYLLENNDPKKKLKYSTKVMKLRKNGAFVCVDTHLPNKIVYDGILSGKIRELLEFEEILREVKYGEENSKIDILLKLKNEKKVFVEVKNVTLVENDLPCVAQFPDAVSSRGAKHLRELVNEVQNGNRAVMFYLVNRNDCNSFKIAEHIDSEYKKEFDRAISFGVEVLVYRSFIDIDSDGNCKIEIGEKINFD